MKLSRILFLSILTSLTLAAYTAWATQTWTQSPAGVGGEYRASLMTMSNATVAAPTLSTDGFAVSKGQVYQVSVEALNRTDAGVSITTDAGANVPGGHNLLAYVWVPGLKGGTGNWSRAPALDLAVPPGGDPWTSLGITVSTGVGRVAYVSDGGSMMALKIMILSQR